LEIEGRPLVVQSMAAGGSWLLAAASALSMTLTAAGADLEWLRFRSERGRFAVQLPGSPEEIRGTRATLGGAVHWTEYRARRGATEFRVEHHDLPWLAKFLLSTDALLKRAKNGLVSEENGHELSSAVASVQGYPAREVSFRVRAEEDLAGDALFVLVDGRLYLLAALGPQAKRDASALDRFFRSFEVWKSRPSPDDS
jgi:hypothetical protein